MFIRYLIIAISLLFITINAQDKVQKSALNIPVAEHKPSNDITTHSDDQSWQTTTERTLIRVPRLNTKTDQSVINKRERRQLIDGEEIMGMAKKIAIAIIVVVSLCILCCLVTTCFICVKCCCRRSSKRKRNQGPTTTQVPQPIFVHTNPSGYQPQYNHQQVPQTWSPVGIQSLESHPMLPQPSAPPQPNNYFHMEHPPPPYEKLYRSQ